ncbi:MAG: tetratricopeptide repeat protein [Brevinema sp.]
MGKVIRVNSTEQSTSNLHQAIAPVPLAQFDQVLLHAEELLKNGDYTNALKELLSLEVTKFDNIRVHELLADLYLKINKLDLAKEQCQICAHLIGSQYETSPELHEMRTFEDLVHEAGDIGEVTEQYKTLMANSVNHENFHQGTKVAFNFATLLMAQNKYPEAERVLRAYKESYLKFLKSEA